MRHESNIYKEPNETEEDKERKETKKERNKEESAEEAKRSTKDKVARGVARVAGALEGFTSKSKEEDLPHKAEAALHKAGEAARKVTHTTRQEFRDTKQAFKEDSGEAQRHSGSQRLEAAERPKPQAAQQQSVGQTYKQAMQQQGPQQPSVGHGQARKPGRKETDPNKMPASSGNQPPARQRT